MPPKAMGRPHHAIYSFYPQGSKLTLPLECLHHQDAVLTKNLSGPLLLSAYVLHAHLHCLLAL